MKRARLIIHCFISLSLCGLAGDHPGIVNLQYQTSLADSEVTFVGEKDGDWAAYSTSPAGDVNGDGFNDILIGAPRMEGLIPGNKPGKAYLFLGRPKERWMVSPINLSQADASFLGCEAVGMSARQNYSAGDVNGDGYDDFLLSGWKCSDDLPYQGKAFLFLGHPNIHWGRNYPMEQADSVFVGEQTSDYTAYYVSTAGDVNGDHYDDFLITATQDEAYGPAYGRIYLILGRATADWGQNFSLANADAIFIGEEERDHAGRSAASAGDVNGDGLDDFLIGAISEAPLQDFPGKAYLILGRAAAD